MSLINDALKRARQAQQNNPPPTPDLEFRPMDPGQEARKQPGFALPVLGALLVAATALLIWSRLQAPEQSAPALEASARTTPAVVTPEPAPAAPAAPANAVATAIDHALTAGTPDAAAAPAGAITNMPPAEMAAPQPEPPRLQAIIFNPSRPSAIIGGKTVFVGDRVAGFRVAQITPDSTTLSSDSETNVLVME